ncbi:hypothetical protein SAMN02745163_01571 [Clostridium cavendishii DSM 21758]|uniref:Uncharacterized protein n=1 Tax=Clostridium cavendishii DSM 21758 TaxID=1121302 RepID=A0A1M6HTB5_9CLOT|nr:hypothetical protein [Clostridium cavendishii]SHJ25387.1 hypothetical protein SAMN02745163_01571 [Clostridium cavendishii DSM 21758]
MRFLGKELKFNGFDIFHTGNFNPNAKVDKDLPSGNLKAIGFIKAFLSSVSGDDITLRGTTQIRFSDSNDWDWNSWAGLKYDSNKRKIFLGGAGGVFAANGQGTKVELDLTNQVNNVILPSSTINGNYVATTNQIPTKLSQLQNDIGAGGGNKIIIQNNQPNLLKGDIWIQIL